MAVDQLDHVVSASMQSGVATPESHGGEAERLRLAGPRFSGHRGQKKMAGRKRREEAKKKNKSSGQSQWAVTLPPY